MKKIFKLIICCLLTLGFSQMSFAKEIDIIPPTGQLTIQKASLKDGVYYTPFKDVKLSITAQDNITSTQNLKIFVSNEALTVDELKTDNLWSSYSGEIDWRIDGDFDELNTIYLYVKDEAGNISPNEVKSTKEYTVTYSGEGAMDLPSPQKATYGLPFNISVKEPYKENKFFKGWSLTKDATTESWLSDGTIEAKYINGNITLYAVWGDEPRNLSEVIKKGDWIDLPTTYQNVNETKQSGWRVIEKRNGTIKLISEGTPLTYNKTASNADVIAELTTNFLEGTSANYASYGFAEDLKTTFDNMYIKEVRSVNEEDILQMTGEESIADLDLSKYGGVINNGTSYYIASAADDTKLYYVDGTTEKVSSATNATYGIRPVVILYDVTLTEGRNQSAEWKIDMPDVEVTFVHNDGTNETQKITYKYGNKFENMPELEREGYIFLGWFTEAEGGEKITNETIIKGEQTIYAHWKSSEVKYKVKHWLQNVDAANDENSTNYTLKETENREAKPGTNVTPSVRDYTGFTKPSAITVEVKADGSTVINYYYKRTEYTIIFETNGGNSIAAITQNYGTTITKPADPERTGYTFKGWTPAIPATMPAENISTKATWTANKYTITFKANGGQITEVNALETTRTVTFNESYGTLPEAYFEGHNFLGWFTQIEGGTEITAETKLTQVPTIENGLLNVYAQWEEKLMDLIPSVANEPVLGEGMKAVYWTGENGTGETTADEYTSSMYNYTIGDGKTDSKDSKWANAITEEDGSYWVWIPRYAYKITYTNEEKTSKSGQTTNTATIDGTKTQYGNIDILFMYGTSNTHYRDENGNAVELPENYKVHPAFQAMTTTEDLATNPLGKWDEELEGIWVAKYEASQETLTDGDWQANGTGGDVSTSETIRVVSKPSVISWKNIKRSNRYNNSLNMHEKLNSHQMKNSEWGAVAYLTESAYGRNGNEIGVNQNSGYYTGAGPGGNADVYNSSTYAFTSDYGWNTIQGKKASTTGNIYGIYDMAGGANEYTASYIYDAINKTDIKMEQIYADTIVEIQEGITTYAPSGPSEPSGPSGSDMSESNYNANSSVYGDAIYETSIGYSNYNSWYDDVSIFVNESASLFRRGGCYNDGSNAGIFNFGSYHDNYNTQNGFRPVLCIGEQITIRFNANGGQITDVNAATTTKKVVYGETYGTLPIPTKDGCKFLGWFTETEGGTEITAEMKLTQLPTIENGLLNVYAQWEEKLMDLIPSIANEPVLGNGMKAVYWTGENGTGETTANEYTSSMYNYTMGDGKTDSKDSKWANAITEEDGSYWVWIPRYAYQITYYTNNEKNTISTSKTAYGDIEVLFMYGTSNTQYRDENGNAVDLPEGYKVHPAFQEMTTTEDLATNPLGKWDEELTGIWVAKYEASQETLISGTWKNKDTFTYKTGDITTSSTVRMVSKPSVISWRNIHQSFIYENSLNMHSELNSHEMKNSEWGAVAYLTQSAYGRNGNEIGVNQASDYYTGAGPGGNADVYNSSKYTFTSEYGWNTEQGKKASTTGNIYGVYDMSGGALEYIAAYMDNEYSNIASGKQGGELVTSTDMKTKQVYAVGSILTQADIYEVNSGVYGDAVYETSTLASGSTSWNDDYSQLPGPGNFASFERGGAGASDAGVFAFGCYNGAYSDPTGFRPVLCVPPVN